jgi:hypothetical protein
MFFGFDMRQRELLRQFVFEGGAMVPLNLWQKRTRGFHDQKLPPPPPDAFSRLWLDNHNGMAGLPDEAPRLPIAIEAHFSRDIWNMTGGPSYTAHHTGLSMNLPSPGAMFPAPPPETWVQDLGDHLAAMQQVGWKERREIRATKAKKELKEQLVPLSLPEERFEDFWRLRQNFQAFYGLVSFLLLLLLYSSTPALLLLSPLHPSLGLRSRILGSPWSRRLGADPFRIAERLRRRRGPEYRV